MTDFDDDDWQDLEKPLAGEQKPDVTVRLSLARNRHGAGDKARAYIALRRGAADWVRAQGPRFKVQIGGANANGVRIVADAARGQYKAVELKGVMRLSIGVVTSWPNEAREPAEAKWRVTGWGLVLTLPEDFAKAGRAATARSESGLAPARSEARVAPIKPAPAPVATVASGPESAKPKPAPAKRRDVASSLMGDPPPGRSALAQRSGK
jgi:hypothetical protein